jgi:two-component system KDP operon response regulator KdpE
MSIEADGPTGTGDGPKVLVIDDELAIRRFLRFSLVNHGFQQAEAKTGHEGLNQVARERPDLVLLDLGLPDIDGLEVIRQLREWSQVPIIVLTACGRDAEKVTALEAGADDYLTKPFSVSELVARIRVALRHAAHGPDRSDPPVFMVGLLRVDLTRRRVFVADKEVHLTPTEYRLLTTLVKQSGRVVTHRQLLTEVWGPDSVHESQYLRVYMAHLRRKIEPDPVSPRWLLTEPGVGYRLASPDSDQDGARKN